MWCPPLHEQQDGVPHQDDEDVHSEVGCFSKSDLAPLDGQAVEASHACTTCICVAFYQYEHGQARLCDRRVSYRRSVVLCQDDRIPTSSEMVSPPAMQPAGELVKAARRCSCFLAMHIGNRVPPQATIVVNRVRPAKLPAVAAISSRRDGRSYSNSSMFRSVGAVARQVQLQRMLDEDPRLAEICSSPASWNTQAESATGFDVEYISAVPRDRAVDVVRRFRVDQTGDRMPMSARGCLYL